MDTPGFLAMEQLQSLIDILIDDGFRCVAPQVRDGAILYDTLEKAEQLPKGIVQEQSNGRYRLQTSDSPRHYAWANGPQALKPLTFAPREQLWYAEVVDDKGIRFREAPTESEPVAVLGVRACDLAALALQDKHFLSTFPDPYYQARRKRLLLIAVHCTHAAQTCFCADTGDGPLAESGFDLSLYETDSGYFVTAGSLAGEMLLHRLPLKTGDDRLFAEARNEVKQTGAQQQRQVPKNDLQTQLFAQLDHPEWEAVAERCLSCGNCTQVCPTCFCHSENEVPEISGVTTSHERQWDSCFTPGHSYIHGVTLRKATTDRYRQWLTHKFGSWQEQYERSGCVGCDRCISWCPVGIDPTEELAAICQNGLGEAE